MLKKHVPTTIAKSNAGTYAKLKGSANIKNNIHIENEVPQNAKRLIYKPLGFIKTEAIRIVTRKKIKEKDDYLIGQYLLIGIDR